jgi:hypothetical protein
LFTLNSSGRISSNFIRCWKFSLETSRKLIGLYELEEVGITSFLSCLVNNFSMLPGKLVGKIKSKKTLNQRPSVQWNFREDFARKFPLNVETFPLLFIS